VVSYGTVKNQKEKIKPIMVAYHSRQLKELTIAKDGKFEEENK
jgi:hypothetical protein